MQTFIANLEDKFEYNDRFVKLIFELKNPHTIDFRAGQYIKIKINKNLEQEYFIFSSPTIDHGFEILVDRDVKGPSINYLKNLKLGDEVNMTAPHGEFTLDENDQSELAFIATGVGVAPFYSMILDLLQTKQSKRKITLYWGLDNLDEFFLYEDLELLEKNFPNFDFHPVMSNAIPEWTLCRGNVHDCMSIHEVNADALFYICANEEISDKMKNLFLTNGVKEEQIKIAKYY